MTCGWLHPGDLVVDLVRDGQYCIWLGDCTCRKRRRDVNWVQVYHIFLFETSCVMHTYTVDRWRLIAEIEGCLD